MNSGSLINGKVRAMPYIVRRPRAGVTLAGIFSPSPAIDIILFKVLVRGPERAIMAAVVEPPFSETYRGSLPSIIRV